MKNLKNTYKIYKLELNTMDINCGFVLYDNDGLVMGAINNDTKKIFSSLSFVSKPTRLTPNSLKYARQKMSERYNYTNRVSKLINSFFSTMMNKIVVITSEPDNDINKTLKSLQADIVFEECALKTAVRDMLSFKTFQEFEQNSFR